MYQPRRDERLSWPGWLTYSGRFIDISSHPSATGRAQDRESSPAKDRRSTAVPRNQFWRQYWSKSLTLSHLSSSNCSIALLFINWWRTGTCRWLIFFRLSNRALGRVFPPKLQFCRSTIQFCCRTCSKPLATQLSVGLVVSVVQEVVCTPGSWQAVGHLAGLRRTTRVRLGHSKC